MKRPYFVTAHARERWAERVGRGCIQRSLRRAALPGPELVSRVTLSPQQFGDVLLLWDRKLRVVFVCRDQDQQRRVLTVIRVPKKWEG